jgi:colicin import membrane protein
MRAQRAGSRWPTAVWVAIGLALAVHVAFVLFLVFSVSWRNPKPEAVVVDLYAPTRENVEPRKAPPAPPKPAPAKPELPKQELPKPQLPKFEPLKPPPKIEAPAPPKPDIALKRKQEAEKREAEKKLQEMRLAEARARQAREAAALQAEAERERVALAQAQAVAARARADADYIRRIQAKIRGNVVVPPDMPGNSEAIFDVVQLPTGEIIDVQLAKSSGVRAYDEAVQRAIIKSSPLPPPPSPDLFHRNLTLKFRPRD